MTPRCVDSFRITSVGVAGDADAGIGCQDALELRVRVGRPVGDDDHAGVQ